MASKREIERAMKRMSKKRANVFEAADKKPLFSEKAALELTQHIRELNGFRARSFTRSANRIVR